MKKLHKIYFNWSSGKDASFALYQMQQEKSFDIDLLVTTINSHLDRVTMHGLRRAFSCASRVYWYKTIN
ncbi:MAG: diphthamide synthase (EF-2-diphthine--ammonia ligase) [Parvicella sp.]|jgi:diphthamide synthase (EF-2-diphthine--ammonia ligase)